ncbi:MAG TPA: BamA/TamA family outer membrane protein [Sphingobacteriaceae bacterium]
MLLRFTYLLMIVVLFSGCSNIKYLPKGESLYVGHEVKIVNDTTKKAEAKSLQSDLEGMVRPQPNSKFLGLRIKLWLYNIAGRPRKEKGGLRNLLRNKWGEPPVLASSVDLLKNEQILQNRLENRGYFHAAVRGDTSEKNRKVTATYVATTGIQYLINAVHFPSDSSQLEQTIAATAPGTLLKTGDPYNLDVIKGERDRIDQHLKENGFYFFGPDYILARVDSTVGNHRVNLYLHVKDKTPEPARKVYTIDDVYIYPNFSLDQTEADTSKAKAVYFEGYNVIDNEKLFEPPVFSRTMFFKPGDVYNRREHNLALNRLVNLGTFKFVKNRFEVVDDTDSAKLDVYYYLTPQPKKSLRAEILGTTKSNNRTGTQINLSWRNRNAFGQAEQLSITGYAASEVQVSGTQKGYNTFRFGGEGTLAVPRFLVPFWDVSTTNEFLPRSLLNLGFEYLNRQKLYGVNSYRGSLGYDWKQNINTQHELYPISINYVKPVKILQQYQDSIDRNPALAASLLKPIESQFIVGSTYSYLYNNQAQIARKNNMYFNGTLDLAGNIFGLITGANSSDTPKRLFGNVFSQYIRIDGDYRYYHKLTRTSQWANRIFAGFGLPYGNSSELPFIKQYFTGGSSSNRAFRARSVGPGTFRPPDASVEQFLPEQSGDIKVELNSEYRTQISGPMHGAVFVDAGNIWLYNENTGKPGGKFENDFLSELAVGAGIGIRFDITFLIIRGDLATPLRKPWLPRGERWVFRDFNLASPTWRRENLVFNLAVGYPF